MAIIRVSVKDLRSRLAYYLDLVSNNKSSIEITRSGKITAVLSPKETSSIVRDKEIRKKLVEELSGIWSDRVDMDDSIEYVKNLRNKRKKRIGLNAKNE